LKESLGEKIMDKVLCYSCNKSKNELTAKKSLLMPINLLLCKSCTENKIEPRWIIILAGRQYGAEHVKDYIAKKKYIGLDITASELLI
jgi:NMD protein affecting ribosome stability and mRNA decay